MPLSVFFIVRERERARSLAFLVWRRRLTLSFYALLLCRRHEHCSNVACGCESCASSRGALCSGRNSAVYFGHFFGVGGGGVFMLLTFILFCFFCFFGGVSVRCDSQQVGDTCEKSFTNNSSRFGWMCVRLNGGKREGPSANRYGAFLFPSSSRCVWDV